MNEAAHLETGKRGEEIAAKYLHELGYSIRERNVHFRKDEIDLIAYDHRREMMVFVEVKTRTKTDERYPIRTAVDTRKRACLRRAVARWMLLHNYDGLGRIDVVCIGDGKVVDHLMDLGSDFY